MNPASKNQLRELDRALLALIDERARLLSQVALDDPGRRPSIEDMLRRHAGPFSAQGIADVFAAIERHCTAFGSHEERA